MVPVPATERSGTVGCFTKVEVEELFASRCGVFVVSDGSRQRGERLAVAVTVVGGVRNSFRFFFFVCASVSRKTEYNGCCVGRD